MEDAQHRRGRPGWVGKARKRVRKEALKRGTQAATGGWLTPRRIALIFAAVLAGVLVFVLLFLAIADAAADSAQRLSQVGQAAPGAQATGGVGADVPYADAFNQAGAATGLDPRLLAAVAWAESSFDPHPNCPLIDPRKAQGIMQFMPETAASRGVDPCDPVQAIQGGARFLASLYESSRSFRPEGSWELVLAGYNAGWGSVQQYGGIPPFAETQAYVPKVMARWAEYQGLYPSGEVTPGTGTGATGPGDLVTVGGITVASSIGGNVEALLAAARADGLTLTGSGYRSHERQVELRRQHCGASPYAIYEMPSSQCSPPTARPGASMHELGLAIDFDNCSNHSTRCFEWLVENAAQFGFHNLPSEPWHWSVNGK